jgi:hypothetical protein
MRPWILAALLAPAAAASLATVAMAQAPAAATVRVTGVITAVSPTSITVKAADGATTALALSKTYTVVVARPIDITKIKPGAYVATANTNIDAGSGKSIELRMYDPANRGAEFSRPMAQANTTMTNGTVQTVTKGAGGRELNVYTPAGTRKIVVPPDVKVIGNFQGSPADLKVGANVTANAAKPASGDPIATRVTVNRS